MRLDISEQYQDILKEISQYSGLTINQIKIMEENNQELICNNKGEIVSILNDKFWSWFDNGCEETIEERDGVIKYSFIQYDNPKDIRTKNIYKNVINETSGGEFMQLCYTENPKEKSFIGETFHWSDLCGQHEPIVEFFEEENYWLKE